MVNPCTRSTLFRLVLAIRLYSVGLTHIGRRVLPRKYKLPYWNPYDAWVMRKLLPLMLENLKNSIIAAQSVNREYAAQFEGM